LYRAKCGTGEGDTLTVREGEKCDGYLWRGKRNRKPGERKALKQMKGKKTPCEEAITSGKIAPERSQNPSIKQETRFRRKILHLSGGEIT